MPRVAVSMARATTTSSNLRARLDYIVCAALLATKIYLAGAVLPMSRPQFLQRKTTQVTTQTLLELSRKRIKEATACSKQESPQASRPPEKESNFTDSDLLRNRSEEGSRRDSRIQSWQTMSSLQRPILARHQCPSLSRTSPARSNPT